ncbi:5'-3' exonuclease PLD3 isoform X2 [Narcine bancroftii]|uniref:5'-3' exonuclease PLD3 isoform X2 n=1 Tax=Narcine bancroftii TaxID=1343680 RepID=UPI003831F861
MSKRLMETRRRSKRLNQGQISDLEPGEPGNVGPEAGDAGHLEESLVLTPRDPIRTRSRIPRSSRGSWSKEGDEVAPPVSVKPTVVSLEKMREEEEEEVGAGVPSGIAPPPVAKHVSVKPVVVSLEKMREEEEEEEEEEVGTGVPTGVAPPPAAKPYLRPARFRLQRLQENIPEAPVRRISWSEAPSFPRAPAKPQGTRERIRAVSWAVIFCLLAVALGCCILLLPVTDLLRGLLSSWTDPCQDQCSWTLVESIPIGLVYPEGAPRHTSISAAWGSLLDGARQSVHVAAFYFTLRAKGEWEASGGKEGHRILEALASLSSRGVGLKVAVNSPQALTEDTAYLAENGAEVRGVPLKNLTGGIVHTKLWVVDGLHLYLGSANMDWRSLTQVKELGLVLSNCSCLAQDVERIFGVYWILGAEWARIPWRWPTALRAMSSQQHPLKLRLNGIDAQVYVSSAPPSLSASGRTADLDAILSVIEDAKEFVFISVMDILPLCQFCHPQRFWPVVENRLREAACIRKVTVRLLISCWPHTYPPMLVFLESLKVLSKEPLGCKVEVKIFQVPATKEQERIPFGRVNHNKYMVTDRVAYIGTSNWSEDYFVRTAGVGLVINQTGPDAENPGTVQSQLRAIFLRDWNSDHILELGSEGVEQCLRASATCRPTHM